MRTRIKSLFNRVKLSWSEFHHLHLISEIRRCEMENKNQGYLLHYQLSKIIGQILVLI